MIEDIFAENLVDEPDDIERVVEDGEDLKRNSDGGSDDEKKKDQEEKEKPKIRKTMGPRPVLNEKRLKGPRGIATMEEFFSGIKLLGQRGTEEKDLDVIMKRLELWTHRLYPRGQFDDCLKKIEKLGNKKIVRNYITRIRLGMEDGSGESELVRDEPNSPPPETSNEDAFDQLISSTTGPEITSGSRMEMTAEQRERMLRNRLIAEEKRAARIKRAQELQERFRAQQALKSQSVNATVSSNEPQNNVTLEDRLENGERALQMEVDDTSNTTGVNTTTQRFDEEAHPDEADTSLNENEIQEKEYNRGEYDRGETLSTHLEDSVDKLEKRNDQESSTQEVEEMEVDSVKPQDCNSQDKCENISQSSGSKNNENNATEMVTSEVANSKQTDESSPMNHILREEEIKLTDSGGIANRCEDEEKESHTLKEQKEKGVQGNCSEKENENPNSH